MFQAKHYKKMGCLALLMLCAFIYFVSTSIKISYLPHTVVYFNRSSVNFLKSNFRLPYRENQLTNSTGEKPIILFWTRFMSYSMEELLAIIYTGKEWDPDCCVDVEITRDRKFLDNATAFIIHTRDLGREPKVPPRRKPEQLWILLAPESPVHTPNLTRFNNLFNWTFTYRRDSDVWAPYGETVKKTKPVAWKDLKMENGRPLDEWISNKKKLFGGAISNCHPPSRRERLVKALKNISFPIDIYGACGKRICGRWNRSCDEKPFWKKFAEDYKFFYAAENSLCTEYITEKFWRTLQQGVVPVVYGSANYTREAPPHSYIDVRNFSSAEMLAEYLRKLDKNPELYKKYFLWRTDYDARLYDKNLAATCKLCRKLVEFKKSFETSPLETTKVVKNLSHWWTHMPDGKEKACLKTLV